MSKLRKILSFFLSLSLLATLMLPVSTAASDDVSPIEMTNFDTIGWSNDDMVYTPDVDAPIEALSLDILEADDSLYRVREEEEDLYTVVYRNSNTNLNTAYIFQHPVKYIDDNGVVHDIDTSISPYFGSEDGIGYSSEHNSIKVYYPTNFFSGSALTAMHDGYRVSIGIPSAINTIGGSISDAEVGSETTETEFDKDYIEYENAFGPETLLRYYTTYNGYKEQIVLASSNAPSEFTFIMNTGVLTPQITETGRISLSDPETGEIVASIASILVYDQNLKQTIDNYYELTPIENGTYLLTLHIDEEFLNAPSTIYPVTVDPTFTFNVNTSTNDAIVYSGAPSAALGDNHYHHVGYCDDTYKIGYLLVKFPSLQNSTFFNKLSNTRINSVTYNVRKSGGSTSSSATLTAYYYTGNSWSESSVTYNSANVASNTGPSISSVSMRANSLYSFNITSAAKAWKDGTYSYSKGIVIKNTTNNSSSTYDRVLASTEYGGVNSSYMPYVTVVYRNGYTSGAFTSADAAAKDFATAIYSSGMYVRFEYCAAIYRSGSNYYYTNVQIESPHGCPNININVPSGTTYVGYIHTHPNSESFSPSDKSYAESTRGNAYVVTPQRKIYRYNYASKTETTVATSFDWHELTDSERTTLVNNCRSAWNSHLAQGCDFGCSTKTWPNPDFA